jgi:hypothetical protein
MKYKTEHFFCSPKLLQNVDELEEVFSCVKKVDWKPSFEFSVTGKKHKHQTAYNKAFSLEFKMLGNWKPQPLLHDKPRLIGDFQKNDVFVEIQFGNSSTIYRDYYKFHYGLTHNLLSLAVLIVPTSPKKFFPTRPKSVQNMAEFDLAFRYFKLLPIPVPILLIGLLPEN